MHVRSVLASLGVSLALGIVSANAQTYAPPHPTIRSTSIPALAAIARERALRLRFDMGLQAQSKGAWAQSAADFEAALKLQPPEPAGSTAHYDLSLAYVHLGRLNEAAVQLREALSLDPAFLAAMANLISVDLQRGDVGEARAIASRFVRIAPNSARALYSRGLIALQSRDPAQAAADFGRLLANDPQYAVAQYDLGIAQARLHNDADAKRAFTSALAIAPTYAQARFALATVFLREGHKREAREAFDRAAKDAQNDPALRTLARSMYDAIDAP